MPDTLSNFNLLTQVNDIRSLLQAMTPAPWSVRPNADVENDVETKSYYIAGPPGTKVVADNLTFDDAFGMITLMNHLPDTLNAVEDLGKFYSFVEDDTQPLSSAREIMTSMVRDYYNAMSRMSGDAVKVPPANVVGELTFMHVGCVLVLGTVEAPVMAYSIAGVAEMPGTDLVQVATADSDVVLILSKDTPIVLLDRDGNVVVADDEAPPKK